MDNKKTVRMVFDAPFTLKISADKEIQINKGVNHIPENLQNHWYLLERMVPDTGEEVVEPNVDAEAALKMAMDLEAEVAAANAKIADAEKAKADLTADLVVAKAKADEEAAARAAAEAKVADLEKRLAEAEAKKPEPKKS